MSGGGGDLKKGPWSAAEDAILVEYVKKHGEGNWNAVQRNTSLMRCGKSCRLRWANHLRPNLKKGAFTPEEERIIVELHSKLGNKWARISAHLPGRTDNEVKNYWNTRVKRRLRQGLPLYPHGLPKSPNPLSSPSPPSPLSHLKPPPTSLPLFDPLSLSSPTSFFSLHPPSVLSPHRVTTENSLLGQSVSAQSLAPIDPFHLSTMCFNFESPSAIQTQIEPKGYDPCGSAFVPNSELPSNQFCQKIYKEAFDDQNFMNPYIGPSNSGLLDALLQEAHARGENKKFKRESVDFGLQWENSSSENSYVGVNKKEEQEEEMSSTNEDLSSILDLIPPLVRVPNWCNGGDEASMGQSSANNTSLDMPQLSPFPVVGSAEEDCKTGSFTWDHLPRIC
ncbi:hypothetical protein Nepgr_007593 [Nepenthes gracilis]|uniref:Uncharacterized protein n=1 Tax=Nepenthes gracilis TaxID=150966 RepID=A0AAD3S7B1_NEPGR|nr:hypothetical protein Nepgr_007593 [Nepenthes gracilis]